MNHLVKTQFQQSYGPTQLMNQLSWIPFFESLKSRRLSVIRPGNRLAFISPLLNFLPRVRVIFPDVDDFISPDGFCFRHLDLGHSRFNFHGGRSAVLLEHTIFISVLLMFVLRTRIRLKHIYSTYLMSEIC